MNTAPTGASDRRPQTLAGLLQGRRNAYGLIRFVLASLVIVNHAFPLGGFGDDPMWEWTKGQESFGGLAVSGFFIVSGFLICRSAMATDLVGFLWRRVLRIFPAFWLALFVGAAVIGPWMYATQHGSLTGYLTRGAGGPLTYLTSNAALEMNQYGILDVFMSTPYGESVKVSVLNGPLWTLEYEWRCYLMLAALGVFGVLHRAKFLVPIAAAALTILAAVQTTAPELVVGLAPWLSDVQMVRLSAFFLLGSAAALYPERVPLDGRLAMGAAIAFAGTLFFREGFRLFGVPAMAYLTLWFAYRAPQRWFAFGAKNDYSYGIYVYGFLVQMTLAQLGWYRWGVIPYIILAWLGAVGCAMISWHLVEKQALKFKGWGPGRGWPWIKGMVGVRAPVKSASRAERHAGLTAPRSTPNEPSPWRRRSGLR